MEIKFNNLTEQENKIAVSFLKEAESYFDTIGQSKQFTIFFNMFNAICNNRQFDPNQFIMQFSNIGKDVEPLTTDEHSKLEAYKIQLISLRGKKVPEKLSNKEIIEEMKILNNNIL